MKTEAASPGKILNVDSYGIPVVDVYFSRTSRFSDRYPDFRKVLSYDENLRADQFHFEEIRQTYVISHGFLRVLLAARLGIHPPEVMIRKDARNKPFLEDNPLFFNLSHTRNAFAIAISPDFNIGIDLEKVNKGLDYGSVSGSCLNSSEQMYIEETQAELYDRFFFLWTRKEAYLKALGTGITSDLWKIRSFQHRESLRGGFAEDYVINAAGNGLFFYTDKISGYFLSIAAPGKIKIKTNLIDEGFCEEPDPLFF